MINNRINEQVQRRAPSTIIVLVTIAILSNVTRPGLAARLPGNTVSDSAFTSAKFVALDLSSLSPFSSGHLTMVGWPEGISHDGIQRVSVLATIFWQGFQSLAGPINGTYFYGLVMIGSTTWYVVRSMRKVGVSEMGILICVLSIALSGPMLHWFREVPEYCAIWIPYYGIYSTVDLLERHTDKRRIIKWSLTIFFTSMFTAYFTLWIFVGSFLAIAINYKLLIQKIRILFFMVPVFVSVTLYYWSAKQNTGFSRSFSEAVDRSLSLNVLNKSHFLAVSPLLIPLLLISLSKVTRVRVRNYTEGCSGESTHLRTCLVVLLGGLFFIRPLTNVASTAFPTTGAIIPFFMPVFRHGVYYVHLLHFATIILIIIMIYCSANSRERRKKGQKRAVLLFAYGTLSIALFTNFKFNDSESEVRWMTSFESSPVIDQLASLPSGPVLHYPWDATGSRDATPCLLQYWHKKPLVNICDYAAPTTRLLDSLTGLATCDKVSLLSASNVRYVLAERWVSQEDLTCLNTPTLGYSEIASDDQRILYAKLE